MSKFKPETVEKNSSSTIDPPAGIKTPPLGCQCNALTTKLTEVQLLLKSLNTCYSQLRQSISLILRLYACSTSTRKVKVLPLPETIREKSTFRAKALRRELV